MARSLRVRGTGLEDAVATARSPVTGGGRRGTPVRPDRTTVTRCPHGLTFRS
ncbi:hypothetical protein [Kineosporia succinea]|uniref:Uncharacterized protein n=1 Tax=Kineosporia succinea TaxID=84632 RepID=A0ABT9PDI8_9ACTN|nr:hypothetical protein [Kineosporia succinea]MDP9830551.1 hypothetical protein [Kineosporia succinea]